MNPASKGNSNNLINDLGLQSVGVVPPWEWLMSLVPEAEAARILGIKRQSLRKKRMMGGGPPYCRLSNHSQGTVRYRIIDILKFAAARRYSSTAAEKWPTPAVGGLSAKEG